MKTMLLMWIPFAFVLSVLGYVSVRDFKTRRVSNGIWIFTYPIGCAMALASIAFNLVNISVVLVSLVISLFLGLGLFCSGFYGSADAKALIFIGLTLPTIPHTLNHSLGLSALPVILVVFCFSSILSLIWPLSIFSLNLKDHLLKKKSMFKGIQLTLRQKIWLLFTSRLIPLDKLDGLRYFPAETVVIQKEASGKPARKLLRFVKAETNLKKYIDNLKEHSKLYPNGVLASPTIPTIIFFTIALAIIPFCT
jgi:Flp pilus assembly protein protease CpaA